MPTGTVLFSTSTGSPSTLGSSSTTVQTRERSASPEYATGGVSTQTNRNSAPSTASPASSVKREPLGVLREQLVEARLEDRHLASLEPVDLLGDDVADDHVVAELREARSSDEADVACAEDADPAHGREAYPDGNGRRPLAIESMVSLESLSSSEFTTQ